MFNDFFSFTPTLSENGSYYIVSGVNFRDFENDLKSTYGTSVIASRVLSRISSSRFRVHKFFTVELAWILDDLINKQAGSRQRHYRVGINKYRALYEQVKTNTWVKTTYQDYEPYDLKSALSGFKIKPYPDQQAFLENYSTIKFGFQLRGCLLDAAPGSGKTPTSLIWSRMISKGKTIILVPKHLIEDPWVDHLDPSGERYCFSKPPKYWLSTDNSDPLKSDAEFFVFYTEQVRKDNWKGIPFTKIIDKLSKSGSEPAKMIIDESHNYNDFGSQQTRGMVDFASNLGISDVLFMSGTPLKAQGKETYPMFIVLDKYFDVNVREDFKKMYSRDNFFLNEMLAHRLGRIKFTINAINGMEDPPKPEVIPVSFPGAEKYTLKNIRAEMIFYIQERAQFYQKNMNNYVHDWKGYVSAYEETIESDKELLSELAQYRNTVDYFRKYGFNTFTDSDKSKFCKSVEAKIEKDLRGEDLRYFRHIVPAIKYLGLKLRGEALGNVLGKARIGAIVESIEHLNLKQLVESGIKKTAIYSTYIEAIDAAYNKLKNDGCSPIRLHSGDKADVNDVIKKMRSPSTDSLVTSFDTLSEGTPLLMCNNLLLLNAPWREYQLKQTIARIYRRGQDVECFVWLVSLDTGNEENITTRTIDIMEYFKEQVDQLLNGGIGFDTIDGVSIRLTDNKEYKFEDLVPFDIPVFKFRPKFKERSFSSLFR